MSNTPTSSAQVAEGLNLEAERDAPELMSCPHCNGRVEWCECGACGRVWCAACKVMTEFSPSDECDTLDKERAYTADVWNRRAAPVAEGVALPPLPPIDEHWMTNDHTYTAEQVRQAQRDAIAPYAERIRQLERELKAARAVSDKHFDDILALRTELEEARTAGPAVPYERVEDLAALVRKLVRALRKADPATTLADGALGYLKRNGLSGSPLRAADPKPQEDA